ncbi:hypothetical protein HK103_003061 [Boothiomyces macroporosus]|uniref:NADH dehydrogenase [ubiquinone] 1 alpha subcomplex subunit n=1 Tax=Boothiomyces macroporosus TaxID=261099 RepID=A0AAD5U9W3_9FUNG|nr:hypothetical protein HK103_003061 [Boothiomyces macroporosus]
MLTLSSPKTGTLVGSDFHGNEYYENRNDISGRDRWVVYNKWNFDATQVPPEWHQWIHRMTDEVPDGRNFKTSFYTPTHAENHTGTRGAFKTYSTVKPKIQKWEPKVLNRE